MHLREHAELRTSDFWRASFDIVREEIACFEALVASTAADASGESTRDA